MWKCVSDFNFFFWWVTIVRIGAQGQYLCLFPVTDNNEQQQGLVYLVHTGCMSQSLADKHQRAAKIAVEVTFKIAYESAF